MDDTEFASAKRTDQDRVYDINRLIVSSFVIDDLMNKLDQIVFILDENRQTVYANRSALAISGAYSQETVLGKRPGEIFGCRYSDCFNGCGTSKFCRECGAVNAILKTQRQCADVLDECVISTKDGTTYELAVSTRPFSLGDCSYTLFSISDISAKKRMAVLEKIFFHDVINIAGGIHSMLQLVKDGEVADKHKVNDMLISSSEQLLNEINAHKMLRAAECGDLIVKSGKYDSEYIVKKSAALAEHLKCAVGKIVEVRSGNDNFMVDTDETLLCRILLNMLTNALEASAVGDVVTISVRRDEDEAVFDVQNLQIMPDNIKRNIFVRSFTTKKHGSGLGTHSIKMLTEKYLKGKVSFVSAQDTGTVFTVRIPISR